MWLHHGRLPGRRRTSRGSGRRKRRPSRITAGEAATPTANGCESRVPSDGEPGQACSASDGDDLTCADGSEEGGNAGDFDAWAERGRIQAFGTQASLAGNHADAQLARRFSQFIEARHAAWRGRAHRERYRQGRTSRSARRGTRRWWRTAPPVVRGLPRRRRAQRRSARGHALDSSRMPSGSAGTGGFGVAVLRQVLDGGLGLHSAQCGSARSLTVRKRVASASQISSLPARVSPTPRILQDLGRP